MAREKIRIKKIENATARHVTFSKRRRGLFKKAEELCVLCDAEAAIIIFSSAGKLFEFSSSSMPEILERYRSLSKDLDDKSRQPSQELQLMEIGECSDANKNLTEESRQSRQMRGEDLQGLSVDELQHLENLLEDGLNRVIEKKMEKIMREIDELQQKGTHLALEKERLKQQVARLKQVPLNSETGTSSEEGSSEWTTDGSNSSRLLHDPDNSDTSLKLW